MNIFKIIVILIFILSFANGVKKHDKNKSDSDSSNEEESKKKQHKHHHGKHGGNYGCEDDYSDCD